MKQGTRVVLFADTRKDTNIVDGFFTAAKALGADANILLSTPIKFRGDPSKWALDFLGSADFALNLLSMDWLYQRSHEAVLNKGAKVLMVADSLALLLKLPPNEKVVRLLDKSSKLLGNCRRLRIRSDGGTNVTMERGDRPVLGMDGLVRGGKSDWDNFPPSLVSFAPLETSPNVTLVINEGDILIQLRHFVKEHIICKLKDGLLTGIEGGADAKLLQNWLQKFKSPNSYRTSHIGWGCEHRAEINPNLYRPT